MKKRLALVLPASALTLSLLTAALPPAVAADPEDEYVWDGRLAGGYTRSAPVMNTVSSVTAPASDTSSAPETTPEPLPASDYIWDGRLAG